jgi:hypothetical protein
MRTRATSAATNTTDATIPARSFGGWSCIAVPCGPRPERRVNHTATPLCPGAAVPLTTQKRGSIGLRRSHRAAVAAGVQLAVAPTPCMYPGGPNGGPATTL